MGSKYSKKSSKGSKFAIALIYITLMGAIIVSAYYLIKNQELKNNNGSDLNNNISNTNITIQNSTTNETANGIRDNQTTNTIPENTVSNDLFGQYYAKAEEKLSTMSIEEKVGQMFLVRYPKTDAIEQIKELKPGGLILFGGDFENETKESAIKKINNCQEASEINLIIGVDEEGGTVTRVSAYKAFRNSKFLSPQQLYKQGGIDLIKSDAIEKSKLLLSLGINLNLAPVSDVSINSKDFIYARSFGKDAKQTGEYIKEVVKTMKEQGISSTLKHFPGYGNNVDTHTGVAIDKREYSSFIESDFIPFQNGIEAGAPSILVAHNIVESIDEKLPASLSSKVHQILRNNLNFTGIIMTDDLAMDGVKSYVENGQAAVLAVQAGNDILISSDFKTQKAEVLNAVKEGKISEETINEAVKRILAWKYQYEII